MSAPPERPVVLADPREPARRVRLWIDEPAGAAGRRSAVLVLHGFKGFAHWGFFPEIARRLARAGHLAVRLDVSGTGVGDDPLVLDDEEAFARNTVSREIEDLERARAWVAARPDVDAERVGFLGHSMGGGVGLLHAAQHGGWRALAAWAAVASFLRLSPEAIARWRSEGVACFPNARTGQEHRVDAGWIEDLERGGARLDVPRACRAVRAPTLLVHGARDESVPLAEGETLAAALAAGVGRLVVLPEAGHTFGATHPLGATGETLERLFAPTLEHFARHLGDM